MNCVVDTSVLQYLFRIDRLNLLPVLFDDVFVTRAVQQELMQGRLKGHLVPDVAQETWVTVMIPTGREIPDILQSLGAGEYETILLGLEEKADWVILDDLDARRIAEQLDLSVMGTIGLLILAKEKHLIPGVAPLLNDLILAGMWISDEIKQRVLTLTGEA